MDLTKSRRKDMDAKVNLSNKYVRWGISIGTVALILCLLWIFIPIFFYSNDDAGIMYTLSGQDYIYPIGEHPYTMPMFAHSISFLYKCFPFINWYTLLHFVTLFLSWAIIFKAMLDCGFHAGVSIFRIYAYFVFVFSMFGFFPCVMFSFTMTSALAGTSACVLWLTDSPDENDHYILKELFCLILMFLCFNWRFSTGLCILTFYGLSVIVRSYRLWKSDQKKKLKAQVAGVAALFLVLGLSYSLRYYEMNISDNKKMWEFNSARASYLDYPSESYTENPKKYESLGISSNLANLMNGWYCLDDRITTENYLKLSISNETDPSSAFSKWINEPLHIWLTFFESSTIYIKLSMIILVSVFIFAVWFFIKEKKLTVNGFTFLCTFVGTIILMYYLGINGRVRYHAYEVIAIPAAIFSCISLLKACKPLTHKKEAIILSVIFLAGGGAICCNLLETDYSSKKNFTIWEREIYQYASSRKDNYFIYDYTCINRINPFAFGSVYRTHNLISLGANPYDVRMKLIASENETERITGKDFLRENFYFLTTKDNPTYEFILNYLLKDYGASGMEIVGQICDGQVVIIKFY